MTRITCEHDVHAIAALVLGGLDADEATKVRAQVEGCENCRREHDEIAGLPRLLERARSEVTPVPMRVRDRVLTASVRRRERRRWIALTVAASLAVGAAGVAVGRQLAPAPAATMALEAGEEFIAEGSATFRGDNGTVVVHLIAEGLGPLSEPAAYEAWLYRTDGRIVSIGQLDIGDDGVVDVELQTYGSLDDFALFWVTAEPDRRDPAHEGPTVLRSSVPRLGPDGGRDDGWDGEPAASRDVTGSTDPAMG